jgi:hypothetical protein
MWRQHNIGALSFDVSDRDAERLDMKPPASELAATHERTGTGCAG